MNKGLLDYYNYGQKRCYKCNSKACVRRVKHDVLYEVYNVCCSSPECSNTTSRNYAWRSSAVEAWNRKPNVWDLVYDAFLEKIFEKMAGGSK